MKRIALAAAIAGAFAAPAFAQSDVTIYGRLNTSIERQKDGDTKVSGVFNNSSRIGFMGTEDLGGGLKAIFQLEHGFNSDDGAATHGNGFWARESWVGLTGSFGTVRLGNTPSATYFASADYVSLHNHDTGSSADALYAYVNERDANKIAYKTPSYNGLTAEVQFTLREQTGNNSWDLAVNYDEGPLHLGGGYVKSGEDKLFVIRGLYEMGDFTFGGYYERDDVEFLGKRNNFRLSAMYTVGASEFHANVGIAGDWDDLDDSGAKQFTLAYNYNLSKRTKLYALYTRVSNDDAAAYNVTTPGDNFSSFGVGIRHNF